MSQRIGVVLAGGAGRRMGVEKGHLPFEGTTLALRAARALWPVCGSVVISVAPAAGNPAPGFPAVPDAPPRGRGPLAGILAAFDATGGADLLVLACDYPFVGPELLAAVADSAREPDGLVMPVDPAGRDHPLVALWKRSTAAHVREALEKGTHKVRSVLAELPVRRLGASDLPALDLGQALRNWNVPADRT